MPRPSPRAMPETHRRFFVQRQTNRQEGVSETSAGRPKPRVLLEVPGVEIHIMPAFVAFMIRHFGNGFLPGAAAALTGIAR